VKLHRISQNQDNLTATFLAEDLTSGAVLLYDDSMNTAVFIFHAGLNFFLSHHPSGKPISLTFEDHQSVKHLIESLGIPHVEVGLITANNEPVDFSHLPIDSDQIDILPVSPGCPVEPRFILDCHLGRLAAHLRMLGFDTLYDNNASDDQLAETAITDDRILITRDRRLLMRKFLKVGYCPRSLEPEEQLVEVIHRFQLQDKASPFRYCLRCNGLLKPVDKAEILDRLRPLTRQYFNEFVICATCNRVYWKGSHYQHMLAILQKVI
jgi:uncharacterized protein with PIN domain